MHPNRYLGQAARWGTAVVFSAVLSVAAGSQAFADTEFRSPEAQLKILTEECAAFAWSVGKHQTSVRFRPANIGENGARTNLALHFTAYWAERYLRDADSVGSGFREYNGGGLSSDFFEFSQPTQIKFVLKDTKTGGAVTDKTKKLNAKIQFRDFDGITDCDARLQTKMTKR